MGSGKSSLLEALLGEILPIQDSASSVTSPSNSPILRGRVAYCSQVPWIVSGTLRVSATVLRITETAQNSLKSISVNFYH